jgi:CO/xanthine dehydrogenase FAD-binding subunit
MSAHPIAYHRPHEISEALTLLQRPDARPLAGGVWLLARPFKGEAIDLQELGLNQINENESGALTVGATTRLTDLDAFLAAEENGNSGPHPLLREAIRRAGPNTRRNAATLGGVIASRLPDSELLAVLLLLDAQMISQRPDATATLSLADYLAAPERSEGLITAVTIPMPPGAGELARVARTPADDPIVAVVCWRSEDGPIALAAVGASVRPCRLTNAEQILQAGLTPETVEQAAAAAKAAVDHPGDFRGDAAYRGEMTAVLIRRLLTRLHPN